MAARILPTLVLILATVLVIATSTFMVKEQELALRVRLSAIVESDYKPGLHFKVPFMEDVVKFDRRVLTRKFNGEQFLTSESQGLTVDYYIKWQIFDPSLFYQATAGDESTAATLVGDNIQDGIKNAVAGRTLKEIVTSDRQKITGDFQEVSRTALQKLGIQLIDVRVQRIDLQEDVAARVYESMKQSFEGIANTQRGEGEREAQKISSDAQRRSIEITAKAQADAQQIRGEGDATAAAIYAAAYGKNPDFYSFSRSLAAYRNSFAKDRDILVLSPDSEFFRYMKTPTPQKR